MLEQYKKRFVGMQCFITLVVCGIYLATNHRWAPAVMFFITMQIGALLGAAWASRLRRRIEGRGW